jgi:hypothetical protein
MDRWERSHGRVGVAAPSWLTFEVHRPYFDGEAAPITAIQAKGPVVAARLFAARRPEAPRFGMVMPASFRTLLVEESRLREYRAERPADLPAGLASPAWAAMADAFARRDDLDDADRAGLALWLVAACLPRAVLDLAPADLDPAACRQPLPALVQYARATASFQLAGLTDATGAAFAALVDRPEPTVAHLQACAAWSYTLARHAEDWSAADGHARRAAAILDELAPGLPAFDRGIWRARLLVREAMLADRRKDPAGAWAVLDEAGLVAAEGAPASPEQEEVAAEMRRRIVDRRVEIAVQLGDRDAEEAAIAEGLKLDPWCVKIRMQAAQAAERRGDLPAALAGYLAPTAGPSPCCGRRRAPAGSGPRSWPGCCASGPSAPRPGPSRRGPRSSAPARRPATGPSPPSWPSRPTATGPTGTTACTPPTSTSASRARRACTPRSPPTPTGRRSPAGPRGSTSSG